MCCLSGQEGSGSTEAAQESVAALGAENTALFYTEEHKRGVALFEEDVRMLCPLVQCAATSAQCHGSSELPTPPISASPSHHPVAHQLMQVLLHCLLPLGFGKRGMPQIPGLSEMEKLLGGGRRWFCLVQHGLV